MLMVLLVVFLLSGNTSAQTKPDSASPAIDSTKARVYPDTLIYPAVVFSSNGPNYPEQSNNYLYFMTPNQSPLWRTFKFGKDFNRELVGFILLSARLDDKSVHKYECTLYAFADTSAGENFQKRTHDDTTKMTLGAVPFKTGNKPKLKIDTTYVKLDKPLDVWREDVRGMLGIKIKRPPVQALDDSKTTSVFVGFGFISRERGQPEVVSLNEARARFGSSKSDYQVIMWALGILFVLVMIFLVRFYLKKRKKR